MPSLCKQGVRGSSPLGSTYLPLSDASYLLAVDGESREVQQRVQQWWPTECLQWPLLGRWSGPRTLLGKRDIGGQVDATV